MEDNDRKEFRKMVVDYARNKGLTESEYIEAWNYLNTVNTVLNIIKIAGPEGISQEEIDNILKNKK